MVMEAPRCRLGLLTEHTNAIEGHFLKMAIQTLDSIGKRLKAKTARAHPIDYIPQLCVIFGLIHHFHVNGIYIFRVFDCDQTRFVVVAG